MGRKYLGTYYLLYMWETQAMGCVAKETLKEGAVEMVDVEVEIVDVLTGGIEKESGTWIYD